MNYRLDAFYVPQDVLSQFDNYTYKMAGVINLETYFSKNAGSIPEGDPGAMATDQLSEQLLTNLNTIYKLTDSSDYRVNSDVKDYELMRLAMKPRISHMLSEKFRAIKTLEDCDIQTVHANIFQMSIKSDIYTVEPVDVVDD